MAPGVLRFRGVRRLPLGCARLLVVIIGSSARLIDCGGPAVLRQHNSRPRTWETAVLRREQRCRRRCAQCRSHRQRGREDEATRTRSKHAERRVRCDRARAGEPTRQGTHLSVSRNVLTVSSSYSQRRSACVHSPRGTRLCVFTRYAGGGGAAAPSRQAL
eukprot:6635533-Prymnesium_polylepis.1